MSGYDIDLLYMYIISKNKKSLKVPCDLLNDFNFKL